MDLPKKLKVLGRTFRVRLVSQESMPEALGKCHADSGILEIAADQTDHSEEDTVLHEILHAILYSQGRENGGAVEELYVRALATGLHTVLRENPALVGYLTRKTPR